MKIGEIFGGLNMELRGQIIASGQIQHAGGKGAVRETALLRLLSKYFPSRYSFGTGDLVSITGRRTKQCDIVIHDGFRTPPLFRSEDHTVFSAEAVFGVIEVKSVLTAGKLREAYLNIESAKLTATNSYHRRPFWGGIFAYSAGRTIDAVAKQISDMNNQVPSKDKHLIPDSVTILDRGQIEPSSLHPEIRILRSEHNTLLHFFVRTLNALNKIEIDPVDLSAYLSLPVKIDGLTVTGHDRYFASGDNGKQCLLRLRDEAVRRIYKTCQEAGEQKLIDDYELEQIRSQGVLGALVVGTGFVYNPAGRRIISHHEVPNWSNGRAIVDPNELYPQDYITIDGQKYYLDMDSLADSDFEENTDLVIGELRWEPYKHR